MNNSSITTIEQLEDELSCPTPAVIDAMACLDGNLVVLGASGKMGPTLCRMAQRAFDAAGKGRKVIAVSRFSDASVKTRMESWGIDTISGNLLDTTFVNKLPQAANVVFMAGMKFGATGNEAMTWAMNTLLPTNICRYYAHSRIAVFSTGNVYGMTAVHRGGSLETDMPNPVGEYAMSCLGRERIFEHFARTQNTDIALIRLNYACELRYGVLVDLAKKIRGRQPIDLSMGMANVIWQADANAMSLMSLSYASNPPFVINIAGPEQLSIERACYALGQRLECEPILTGQPSTTAFLTNGQKAHQLFGYPVVPIATVMNHVASWINRDGYIFNKPTRFEVIDGKF